MSNLCCSSSDDEVLESVRGFLHRQGGGHSAARSPEAMLLCGNEFAPCDMSKVSAMGYRLLCESCYNACHCVQRALQNDSVLKSSMHAARRDEPLKVKGLVLSLRTTQLKARSKDRVREIPALLKELCVDAARCVSLLSCS